MHTNLSRRRFLKTVAVAIPAAAVLGACSDRGQPAAATPAYLSHDEAAFIDAATARLIPSDQLGGGAREAGVRTFIDLQLAGPYGRAERWYMQGPWPTGTDMQGFQLKYSPAQIYRQAIAGINAHCHRQYGKPFAQLSHERQDALLQALEGGKLDLGQVPADTFFGLLWQNTQEGFLADPVYGGNRDFTGWKLIGFPGPRYNYVEEIDQYGKRYQEPYVSLAGRNPTPPGSTA